MPNLLVPTITDLPAGTVHVELPTPFPVGAVNCYLLTEAPVTVIDPGMLYGGTVETLTAAIEQAGLKIADIEVVLVTHGHPDHFGAAGWLADKAGAAVLTGRDEVPKLLETRDRERLLALIRSFGIPDEDLAVFPAREDTNHDVHRGWDREGVDGDADGPSRCAHRRDARPGRDWPLKLLGPGGVLTELTKRVMETALGARRRTRCAVATATSRCIGTAQPMGREWSEL